MKRSLVYLAVQALGGPQTKNPPSICMFGGRPVGDFGELVRFVNARLRSGRTFGRMQVLEIVRRLLGTEAPAGHYRRAVRHDAIWYDEADTFDPLALLDLHPAQRAIFNA